MAALGPAVLRQLRAASRSFSHRACVWYWRKILRRRVVLFERLAGIGDIICTFPAVLALRGQHPDAIIVYSVRTAFRSVVVMGRVADCVVGNDEARRFPQIHDADYDVVYRPRLEDEEPHGRPHLHLVDDFSGTMGVQPSSRQPRLHVPPAVTAAARTFLAAHRGGAQPIVAIHVGPSWPVREWNVEGWTCLVQRLQKETGCVVLQLGSDAHTQHGFVRAPRIAGTVDCVDRFSLDESVGVLSEIDLLVGIDSGLLHIAGAVGTPVVGLFGAVSPELRLPLESPAWGVTSDVPCLGCHHRLPRLHWRENCPHDIACMKSLEAATVADQAISALRLTRRPAAQ
ncbi:MAG: glycosyltransferase family 9 protein [Verrucomicrobia bacterium]|nr:glycosyltransferase family 9 protein [Verrucomicrobiota bacterium]